jgi:UPF0716 protein FxsA
MALLLGVLFLIVPLAEIWAIIQVGQLIGVWWTIALLILDSLLGVWLLRHQGRRAWQRFTGTLGSGQVPAREVADGSLIIFGAALLLTPGFLTDIAGFLCLVPPTRAALRRVVLMPLITAGAASFGPAGVWTVRSMRWGTRGFNAYGARRAASRDYDVEGTASEAGPADPPALPTT